MKPLLTIAKNLLPAIVLLSVAGCFQYPEGPVFTLQTRDERLAGTWRLTSASDPSGADVSSEFNNITLTVIPSRSGDNSWTIFQNDSLISQGTYLFAQHGDQIVIAYSLLKGSHTPTQEFYDIRRLTDKYFYYVDNSSFTLHYQKY
jgi:hypothetical protein